MTEISYITQNGEQINLKDAKGRELLETKQSKLKAGNGISIAADGTISATGAGKELEEAAPVQKLYAYHNNGEDDKGEATSVYGDAGTVYFKKVVDNLKDYEMFYPQGSEGYESIQKDTVAVTRIFDENCIIFEIGDNRCCYYREESSDIEL